MLVAISGSQGLGKSIYIDHLQKTGVKTIERKTSRSILSDWKVELSTVNNDRPLTLKFQDEILKRKIEDEAAAATDPNQLYVTERSFADLFTYACVAIGKDNECSDWLDAYYIKCLEAQRALAGVLYLTREGRINGTIVNDGVRGANRHYGIMVDETMSFFTREMCDHASVKLEFCPAADPTGRDGYLRRLVTY